MLDVVKFAHQILAMQERIEQLERENSRLKKYEEDYNNLLDETLQHNERTVAGLLNSVMTSSAPSGDQKVFKHERNSN